MAIFSLCRNEKTTEDVIVNHSFPLDRNYQIWLIASIQARINVPTLKKNDTVFRMKNY